MVFILSSIIYFPKGTLLYLAVAAVFTVLAFGTIRKTRNLVEKSCETNSLDDDGFEKLFDKYVKRLINWVENHYIYASDLSDARVIELDCGHYVHNFKQDQIAEEIKKFVEVLTN